MYKKRAKELHVSGAAMLASRELQILELFGCCDIFEKGTFVDTKLFPFSTNATKCITTVVVLLKSSQTTENLI